MLSLFFVLRFLCPSHSLSRGRCKSHCVVYILQRSRVARDSLSHGCVPYSRIGGGNGNVFDFCSYKFNVRVP